MKRLLPILLLLSALAAAQSTSVTLQVTDTPDGQPWNNGNWSAVLVSMPGAVNTGPPFFISGTNTSVPNQRQNGALSGTGGTAFTLTPNASISPAGTAWQLTVCPQATSPCFTQFVIAVGATQNVTLNPSSIRINGNTMSPTTLAYADTEIVSPPVAAQYFNVTLLSQRIWNGTNWAAMGTGGGGGGGDTFLVNGVATANQTTINFLNSAATNGLTLSFSNPSAGNVQLGLSGALTASGLNQNVVQGVVNDTNVTGSVFTQNLILGWTGTLAAGRLNSNVVQAVTNDTNVTGSIAAQNLSLGWAGTLGVGRGGLNLSSVAINQVPLGTASNTYTATTIPDCHGSSNALNYTQSTFTFTCLSIATLNNPMTTLGDMIVGGSAGATTRLAGPLDVNGVPQSLISVPSGGAATTPLWSRAGVGGRDVAGTTDTILVTDRTKLIRYTSGSAVAVTLPQAGTTGFDANFVFALKTTGGGPVTITPTTSTIDGNATLIVAQGQNCTINSPDNINYVSRCESGQLTVTAPVTTTTSANGQQIACPTCTVTIASGAVSLGTSSIAANSCATTINVSATGASSGDTIIVNPNNSIKATIGYRPQDSLVITWYPTTNFVNFDVCNKDQTNAITPGSVILNWRITR